MRLSRWLHNHTSLRAVHRLLRTSCRNLCDRHGILIQKCLTLRVYDPCVHSTVGCLAPVVVGLIAGFCSAFAGNSTPNTRTTGRHGYVLSQEALKGIAKITPGCVVK